MIKKRTNINENEAFIEACRENNIIFTPNETNKNPVAYIDDQGNKVYFEAPTAIAKKNVLTSVMVENGVKKTVLHQDMVGNYPLTAEIPQYVRRVKSRKNGTAFKSTPGIKGSLSKTKNISLESKG